MTVSIAGFLGGDIAGIWDTRVTNMNHLVFTFTLVQM